MKAQTFFENYPCSTTSLVLLRWLHLPRRHSAVSQPRRRQHSVHGRLFVGNEAHPGNVQVGQRPSVLEGGAGRGVAHLRGVVSVGIERRVQVDEVNRR